MSEKVQGEYGEEQIQVLEGLDPVRKRPGMYIGSTDERGLHHLVQEIVDNSIDEALAGYCDTIRCVINKDGSCSVQDNGRGIPTGIHPKEGVSSVELVLTKLHAGGKFGGGGYKISGGLHGVGLSVVNALSEWLEVEVYQNGNIYKQIFNRGIPQKALAIVGQTDITGTKVTFYPDGEIFETLIFNYENLKVRLRELAYLNKGLTISIRDEREEKPKFDEFCYEGGILHFVEDMNKNKEVLFGEPVYFEEEQGDSAIEVAIQYNDGYSELIMSYANNIHTEEGGTHLEGFKAALTKVINDAGRRLNILKENDKLSGDDVRERHYCRRFRQTHRTAACEGQTKTKLGNSAMRAFVMKATTSSIWAPIPKKIPRWQKKLFSAVSPRRRRATPRETRAN